MGQGDGRWNKIGKLYIYHSQYNQYEIYDVWFLCPKLIIAERGQNRLVEKSLWSAYQTNARSNDRSRNRSTFVLFIRHIQVFRNRIAFLDRKYQFNKS